MEIIYRLRQNEKKLASHKINELPSFSLFYHNKLKSLLSAGLNTGTGKV